MQGDSVRAIRSGAKTQTRRVVKPQPGKFDHVDYDDEMGWHLWWDVCPGGNPSEGIDQEYLPLKCPYEVGQHLWVRETFAYCPTDYKPGGVIYRADGDDGHVMSGEWHSPIHMPRKLSRLTLEVQSVRVERVQSISEEDAKAEGCPDWCSEADPRTGEQVQVQLNPVEEYANLWDSINAARGFPWSSNPLVRVIDFRVLPQPARAEGGGA